MHIYLLYAAASSIIFEIQLATLEKDADIQAMINERLLNSVSKAVVDNSIPTSGNGSQRINGPSRSGNYASEGDDALNFALKYRDANYPQYSRSTESPEANPV